MGYDEGESKDIKLFGTTISLENNYKNNSTKKDEELMEMRRAQEKVIMACPRCKSMETKFCYFNNYNVNQPRHFCKACHRYWTAGGALRNVPVGAGRRKAKPPPPPPPPPPTMTTTDFQFHEWHAAFPLLKRRRPE